MTARSEILADLSARIRQLERARIRSVRDAVVSSAPAVGLRRLLPDVMSLRGGLIEWLSDVNGAGGTSLAVLASQSAVENDLWVFVDGQRQLHAAGFGPLALDLRRMVLVRPERPTDVLWAAEQALRTRGVGAVVCEVDRLSSASFRRLQLAAETGGSLGILLRPERVRHQPSWAEYRLLVRPLPMAGPPNVSHPRRRLLIELLRARRGFSTESIIVELDDADGRVCLAAELASATTAARAAGA